MLPLLLALATAWGAPAPGSPDLSRMPLVFESGEEGVFLSLGTGPRVVFDTAGAATGGVRVRLDGAAAVRPVGAEPLQTKVNRFLGNDPAAWRLGTPAYGRVRYEAVYPGVDWEFHGTQRRLEHDFVVAPGADPGTIALVFDGAHGVRLSDEGDLLVDGPAGTVRHHRPVLYQETEAGRVAVTGEYRLFDGARVGFRVGHYDRTRPLVIDPVLEFSTFYGGRRYDQGQGIGLDAEGNIYVGGFTESEDFATVNPFQGAYGGDPDDMLVLKLNPAGDRVIFATYIGGDARDECKCMVVDAQGHCYISGRTKSSNFPTTPDAFGKVLAATFDICVVKLSPTGDRLVYSNIFGGESMEEARGIAIDAQGNCVVVGGTHSPDFPMTPHSFQPVYRDDPEPDPEKLTGAPFRNEDAFIVKINPEGTAMVFGSFLGGHGLDKAWGCAMDREGNVYVTGHAGARDFPTTEGAYRREHQGGDNDIFVTKFSADGSALLFSTLLGGSGDEVGHGIDVDAEGHVWVGAGTGSTDMPLERAIQETHGGGETDAYLAKLSPDGRRLLFATYLGGSGNEDIGSDVLVVGPDGYVYAGGETGSVDFPTVRPVQDALRGEQDGLVLRIAPDLRCDFATYLGGSANDRVGAMVVDAGGHIYITGVAGSADFPTRNAVQERSGGGADAFVAKIALGTP